MINTKHLLKVSSAWISIVYIICYAGIAIFPQLRIMMTRYALHADVNMVSNYFGFGYFVAGLIVWNVVVVLGVWLFAALFNKIK